MKQQIIFDLDDTLIYCNKYFILIIDQFVDVMTTWFTGYEGITPAAVRDKQSEIDISGVAIVGFTSDHFSQSFVDTYEYFTQLTGRPRSTDEIDFVWKLGMSVYDQEVEPYPNMDNTLEHLANSGHELHLYTGGESIIQLRKIQKMNLERYFGSRIYIRRHKNTEALEDILSSGHFDRQHTWMIGNSIRTDVIPALTSGIHAIHMKAEKEWLYNVVQIEVEPKGAFYTLNHLVEIPPTIQQYLSR